MKHLLLLTFLLLTSKLCKAQWQVELTNAAPTVRVLPNASLHDIAMATFDNFGPVIYYNPFVTNSVGDLATAFFMTHEVGHHNLNQAVRMSGNPLAQMWLNSNQENAADAYAVDFWVARSNVAIIQAGAIAMWNNNNAGDATHPPSRIRAQNIISRYMIMTGLPLFP